MSESATASAASRPSSYRVRRGDTLTKIARRFGVTIDDLRTWNGMSSDRIVVGERLNLSAPAGTN